MQVSLVQLTPDDLFVIWASDGVWEFIDSQAAADIVARCPTAVRTCATWPQYGHGALLITRQCFLRWGSHSCLP